MRFKSKRVECKLIYSSSIKSSKLCSNLKEWNVNIFKWFWDVVIVPVQI